MKKILTLCAAFLLGALFITGCGGGGSSSATIKSAGGGSLNEPILIDSNSLTVSDSTFYRYRMAKAGCKLLIIPDSQLRSVYSYDSNFNRTIGDLRVDGNYLISSTEDNLNIIIKIGTYQDTKVTLANTCNGKEVAQIANDTNKAGMYSLKPIYEDATMYISSSENNKLVFVYDKEFNIINSGQYYINTTPRGELQYFYSNGDFNSAFASDSIGI